MKEKHIAITLVLIAGVVSAYFGNIWGYLSTMMGMYLIEVMYV